MVEKIYKLDFNVHIYATVEFELIKIRFQRIVICLFSFCITAAIWIELHFNSMWVLLSGIIVITLSTSIFGFS